jgi:hypothetical protein
MEGLVATYSGTSLEVTIDLTSGAGTLNDWNINLAGERGAVGGPWTMVKKSADQAITSNNTLANDNTLTFAMAASTNYAIRITAYFDTGAAEDFKYALTGPAAPTYVRVRRKHVVPGATADVNGMDTAATASTAVTGAGTNGGFLDMDITWQNGANAGTFALQWAQNSSGANATTVRAGSYVEYMTLP